MLVKNVQQNGDTVEWTLNVCGDDYVKCYNVQVAFTIPTGVRLTGPLEENSTLISVARGFYKKDTNIWFLGDLKKTECVLSSFTFTVDDIELAEDGRFIVTAVLTSSCTDGGAEDNNVSMIINVTEDCDGCGISITTDNSSNSQFNIKITP